MLRLVRGCWGRHVVSLYGHVFKCVHFEVCSKIWWCGLVLLRVVMKFNLDLPRYLYYVLLFFPCSGSYFEEFYELLKWGQEMSKIRVNKMSKIRVLLISQHKWAARPRYFVNMMIYLKRACFEENKSKIRCLGHFMSNLRVERVSTFAHCHFSLYGVLIFPSTNIPIRGPIYDILGFVSMRWARWADLEQ